MQRAVADLQQPSHTPTHSQTEHLCCACLPKPCPACSIRLPALVALVATQIGLLSTSLSLPMLAPLLLGTGMLLRSIRTNASLVFPRIGLLVVLLWLLWFANSVIQNTVAYLRKQGAIDQRMADNINSAAELTVLVRALAGVH